MTHEEAIEELEAGSIRFSRVITILTAFFGEPRIKGSHFIFSLPWPGPRLVMAAEKGKLKPYQIKDAIEALRLLKEQERNGTS